MIMIKKMFFSAYIFFTKYMCQENTPDKIEAPLYQLIEFQRLTKDPEPNRWFSITEVNVSQIKR